MVRRLNVDGDGQGDLLGHGGVNRAVFVYQLESYRYWQEFLARDDFTCGQFGENFTVERVADDEVCISDRYRIGTALFEVSQPRVTCYRVGIRMNEPQMPSLLVAHRRPGFYFRVLEEGEVEAGASNSTVPIPDRVLPDAHPDVRPSHSISRGIPTLTESTRRMSWRSPLREGASPHLAFRASRRRYLTIGQSFW